MNNRLTPRILFVMVAVCLFACADEQANESPKTQPFDETPPAIIPSKPCSTLYKGIMEMFLEHKKNHETYPMLFSSNSQKEILLKNESEVYITFISEGAGWANAFGYYTYHQDDAPTTTDDIEKHILFPHVSDEILSQGDMLRIGDGEFPAGTVIGFFLITRGWDDGEVNFERETIYTDSYLNHNQYQQHILFKEGDCGDIVLGFEDRLQDQQDCDFDYNDMIFTIADNKDQLETVNFELTNLVVLSP